MAKEIAPHLPGDGIIEERASLLERPAPAWQLRDEQSKPVTLKSLTRQRPLLFHLYRGAW